MEPDSAACRRKALDLLARRDHSRLELAQKLEARSFQSEMIATLLDTLEQEGLLAADRFAESFVRARAAKGQGPVRIRLELARRGIAECEQFLQDRAYDWPVLASQTRVKRFGASAPTDFKERARQARFLEYRGFNHEQIARALEFSDDSD